jgi:hypothetical protein
MPFRDILKKKDKAGEGGPENPEVEVPVFTFMRSDTNTQEIISPPTFNFKDPDPFNEDESRTGRFFKGRVRSSSNASHTSTASHSSQKSRPSRSPDPRRLSERLHLRKSQSSSINVPTDLPDIAVGDGGVSTESQWEKRATILAKRNEMERSRPTTPTISSVDLGKFHDMSIGGSPRKEKGVVSTKFADDNIQEAIRLHEAGDLETSTRMFGRLADPNGENNALSQVLYGLALRYVNWSNTMRPNSL